MQALRGQQAQRASRDRQALRGQLAQQVRRENGASRDRQALRGQLAQQVRRENRENKDRKVDQAREAHRVKWDLRVLFIPTRLPIQKAWSTGRLCLIMSSLCRIGSE